jgi:ABC-type oligopeptide transport system substrate-binding subunit
MTRHSIALILGATLISVVGLAQSAPAQTSSAPSSVPESRLEFEAATIKPVDPNASDRLVGTDVQPGGTIKLNG